MVKAFAVIALALTGCASSISGSTYTDGRFWYSNVKSASDAAGGPRQDVMIVVDYGDGKIVGNATASGVGTLQSVVSTLGAAVVTAGGQAAGDALIRPARNSTAANVSVAGTGGAGGQGGNSNSTGATSAATGGQGGNGGASGAMSPVSVTTSATSSPSANAIGGAANAVSP